MANRILTRKEKQLERLEDELEETPFSEKTRRRRLERRIEKLEDEIDAMEGEESSSKNGNDEDVEVIVVRGKDNVAKLLKQMGIEDEQEEEEIEQEEGEEEEESEEEEEKPTKK